MNGSRKILEILKDDIRFWLIIIGLIASGLWNYFSLHEQVGLNSYRLDQIEESRTEMWKEQAKFNNDQIQILGKMQADLATLLKDNHTIK